DLEQVLSTSDLHELYARLALSNRIFGGLVNQQQLGPFYDKLTLQSEQNRSRNWEMLRQRAELSGLYFEPLLTSDGKPMAALLWIARADLEQRHTHRFEKKFLNISNPYIDDRLPNWSGYTETRWFGDENREVPPE